MTYRIRFSRRASKDIKKLRPRAFFRKDVVFLRGGFVRGQEGKRRMFSTFGSFPDAAMDFAIPQKHDRFFENRSSFLRFPS
jgi:hypothetical protein